MKNKTTEFSFILKPSEHGVGVFAARDIKEGEEITINYNLLAEPEDDKPSYY